MEIRNSVAQQKMYNTLVKANMSSSPVQKSVEGSLFVSSDAPTVPNWRIDDKTDFDKFIKRYGMTAIDEDGKEVGKYTMASRGSVEKAGEVSMIVPVYKDEDGGEWTMIQEEARPIDVARRGKDARVLAFPAGCIETDETAIENAVKELSEETGLVADHVECLNPFMVKDGKKEYIPILTSPGLSDESTNFYSATIKKLKPQTKAVTDGGVTRGWWFVPLQNLNKWFAEMANSGKIASGQTLTALTLMRNKADNK